MSFESDKIYFILLDRFHDGLVRQSVSGKIRKSGFGDATELYDFYGGTLKGVTLKLPYIKKMGFTAIWISPFFHNTPNAYHGYAIKDFMEVDPHFGTKADLKELVTKAHALGIKVYMDVIINHIGDLWCYLKNKNYNYNQGLVYPFGQWNDAHYPQPASLRRKEYFEMKGRITDWEKYPELAEGDFFEMKKFRLDETEESLELQRILAETYCYWIREFDIDGFRIDTARHMTPLVIARFTDASKKQAAAQGKTSFPVFIEAPFLKDDELLNYFKIQKDAYGHTYMPPDAFLDFFLHVDLPDYLCGKASLGKLKARFKSLRSVQQKADSPMHQVAFLDNHDQVADEVHERIANKLNNGKLIWAWEFLLENGATPCLYYGTEQGLHGSGTHDRFIREAMFDKNSKSDLFDENYTLYKAIRKANLKHRSIVK